MPPRSRGWSWSCLRLPAGKRKIAAAVAERYAQSPSYRAFLAEEAERAIRQAAAVAEVAARNAEAVATAQQQLLAELELWTAPQSFTAETAVTHAARPEDLVVAKPVPVKQEEPAGLVVRLYEEAPAYAGVRTPRDASQ